MPKSYSENSYQFLLNDKNEIVFGSDYKNTNRSPSNILILPFYGEEEIEADFGSDVESWSPKGLISLKAAEKDGFRLEAISSMTDRNYTSETVDGVKYLVLYTKSSEYGWTHVQYIPEREIFSSVRTITYILVGATLFFTLVSLVLAYIFSAQITRPIFKLTNMMANYKLGKKLDNSEMVESRNEFRYLFESYKDMIRRTEFLIDDNFRMELNRKQMELKMVKSAIDPHFMYNILDSVHWLLKLGNTEKAMEVLHDFPRYLRNMLHTHEDFISVKSERETIENYCSLQRFFYNEEVGHKIDMPEEIENYSIMPLLLQPIVENAYKYAFGNRGDCEITVAGRLTDGVLEFKVTDNGKGIEPDRLDEIKERIANFEMTEGGKFFGLGSTDRRIKIQYGAQYGLTIESVFGEGTTVTITYPVT
jgi:two-component system sensor histidine kinase YesM